MYTIRTDKARGVLVIELSERLQTEEAERAIEQAFALAQASDIDSVLCDIRALERGPAGLLGLAAVFSLRFIAGLRVAFVGVRGQAGMARRFARFSGHPEAVRYFNSDAAAETWLQPAAAAAQTSQHPRAGDIIRGRGANNARPAA